MGFEITREEYYVRLKWLMLSRILLVTFLLGSLVFVQYKYQFYHFKSSFLLLFAFFVYILSALYWYLLNKIARLQFLAFFQIGLDILLISWLVALTGGVDSSFPILYHVSIISASVILSRKGGYISASLASILYGGMLDLQYYNVLRFTQHQTYSAAQVLYLLSVNIVAFYLIAFLSGHLAERLRKTRQELNEKSVSFDDLRVLQDSILKSVGSGIMTMDLSGMITSWNPAAEQITGYNIDEIRREWRSVFGESIKNIFGHTDDLKERSVRFEGDIVKRSGEKAILGFTVSLLKDDRKQVQGLIIIFQDITRLIDMEEQMRRQERLASIGSLAAGIAHEIRNPLASLSGSIQMLREEIALTDDTRHLMDIVIRETDRLNTIITEFLDYARPYAGNRVRIALSPLMQETIHLFRNSNIFRDSISITCEISSDLFVFGDPQRLRQVFWNLLINSAQAISSDGSIKIRATTGRESGDKVVIYFSDTGEGISEKNIKNIFDPFFTTKSEGTGLGLAIVYRIIEDHRGTISVASTLGKGTTFEITLPVDETALELPSTASSIW